MTKYIILHDANSGCEVRVNALTLKIETVVIVGDWNECTSATITEPAIEALINNAKDVKGTPIRWLDENGKEQFAKVVEQPDVIRDKKNNLI